MSLNDDARLVVKLQIKIAVLERIIDQHSETLERLTGLLSEGRPTLKEISEVVYEYYSVAPEEVKSRSHIHHFAHPRLIIYYLARKLTRMSLHNIGTRMSRSDHTTVRSGFLRISAMIRRNEVLRDDIDELRLRIAEKVMMRETLVGTIDVVPTLSVTAAEAKVMR